MPSKYIQPLLYDSYMAAIRNSLGTKTFQNFYAKVNGKKTDVMDNGVSSCAYFISSILTIFRLSKSMHATVASTIKDLEKSGWKKIKKPKIGSVIVWDDAI